MKIYNHYMHGRGAVYVSPGTDHPETSEWIKVNIIDGREVRDPIMITVKFSGGVAEVPKNLGDYMIEKKLAFRSPLFLPHGVAA